MLYICISSVWEITNNDLIEVESDLDENTLAISMSDGKSDWVQSLNLSMIDLTLLLSNSGWLNDDLIRAAQVLLKKTFPKVGGLSDPLYVAAGRKRNPDEKWLQIINVGDRNHWVMASNFHCNIDHVCVYDSLHMKPSEELSYQLSCLCACPVETTSLKIQVMNVTRQSGSSDCGLFAVANATALLYHCFTNKIRVL